MKFKTLIFSMSVLLMHSAVTSAAPRKVIGENFTATWCGYCPDVANGMIMLMDEFPDSMFSMQIHGGDSYATGWGNLRQSFYSVGGYPTVWLGGTESIAGSYGSPAANYNQLRSRYLNLVNAGTDVTIEPCGFPVDSDTYTVSAEIGVEAGGTSKTMIIHCGQVLHNYPSGSYNYGCFMQASDTTVTVKAGSSQWVEFTFNLDSASAADTGDVTFFVWAQDTNSSGPSSIYQVERHRYNEQDCTIDTWSVGPGGDFETITDALNASGTGDTIMVSPGTYYENINYGGAGIVLQSTDGPGVTIIDGGEVASAVRMYNNASENTVLDGFTIKNGLSPVGGGLHTDGSPQILNCIFVHNDAKMGGAIFHLENGSVGPTITNTYFCDNQPQDIWGSWIDGGGNIFADDCVADDCPADVNGDSEINISDMLYIISVWGTDDVDADVNADGLVDVADLLEVVGNWGFCD